MSQLPLNHIETTASNVRKILYVIERDFGTCDIEIENRKAEPRYEVRENIARTYFYMDAAYPVRGVIPKKNQKLFEAWDRKSPVDAWKCERSRRIDRIQSRVSFISIEKSFEPCFYKLKKLQTTRKF